MDHAPDAAPEHVNHGKIAFEGLRNTRDLGGLPAADGKHIRPGMLLRSDTLFAATEHDRARLRDDYRLSLDIDLRSNDECAERPDPLDAFPGMRYVHLPVFSEGGAGVSRSAEDMSVVEARVRTGQIKPAELMIALYPHIVLDQSGIDAYTAFFAELLNHEEGAALWHCSAGKDRCGMASVLIEVALGVPWELVERDYLATNIFYGIDPATCEPMEALEGVDPRFLAAAVDAMEREYGGVEHYVEDALGVDAGARATLRARYLV